MPDGIRPIQRLEDELAPARLMLKVHRLLDCQDVILTEGDLVENLRSLVEAASHEDLMVVQNEIFVGLVRQRAELRTSDLKSATLAHLLRQSVVLSASALDTFLPAVLTLHLPDAVRVRGRRIVEDGQVKGYLKDLSFSIDEVLRASADDGHIFLANRILKYIGFKYMASDAGVATTCALLGIERPWTQLADQLGRDERDLKRSLRDATERRNDIVHRGDRGREDPTGEPRSLAFSWTKQAVETIGSVGHALNELVEMHMTALRKEAA